VVLECDPSASEPSIQGMDTNNFCTPSITIKTKGVCSPKEFMSWYQTIHVPKTVLSIIIILMGCFILFLGVKYDWAVYFVVVLVFNSILIGIFLASILQMDGIGKLFDFIFLIFLKFASYLLFILQFL
jgi:hypothetical protein